MISAVIITKNEEKNIFACIEALINWTDEIIIFDSGSQDKTLEILNNFKSEKIKITKIEWLGFAKTKNMAIKKASGDWILSIDADEVVTEKLKEEILENIKTNEFNGYFIPRLLFFCQKAVRFGGTYPDYQLRLFRKGTGEFENIPVHEGLKIKDGKVGKLKNNLLHFSYNSIFDYFERFNKYTELDAEKKFKQGKKFVWHKIFILHWEIFRRLILKKGTLDGFPGIFYHLFSALSSLVKYAKLWEKQK